MMGAGLVILVSGPGADGVMDRLAGHLGRRGAGVEVISGDSRLGAAAADVCAMLARHGVTVLTSSDPGPCGARVERAEAAELDCEERMDAFLRRLELSGAVPAPPHELDPQEEESVRRRLEELGYL